MNAYAATASGLFDAEYYARRYADVSSSSMAPLTHFVLTGSREGRDPHPLFDAAAYLEENSDVAGGEPLFHYLRHGAREGRHPHPLFDVSFYLEQNPDVRDTGDRPAVTLPEVGRRGRPKSQSVFRQRLLPPAARRRRRLASSTR